MTKSIVVALLAAAGILICVDNSHAGCRRARSCGQVASCCANPCASSCGTTSCGGCSNGCSANMAPQPAPIATTSNTGANVATNSNSTYQSFSYEPSASNAPNSPAAVTTAPAGTMYGPAPITRQPAYSIYDSVLRGDRKVRGIGL